jgi:predicted nuclease of restriction endonuclease-like (RecB) superfamily
LSKKRFQAKFIPYWDIGRVIFEEEQRGKARADYGSFLIKELSKKLSQNLGKGFDISNLKNMRQFYLVFPNGDALRRHLSWTHYRLIMRVDKKEAREFYMVETINNKWGTRELERQIHSLLFERLALSKDKKKILELSKEGQVVREGKDIIKDPYVLEFLGLKENRNYLEKDLEQALIDKLQNFLLELGKGFSFVARQKRITVGNDHFYIDLVFYNYENGVGKRGRCVGMLECCSPHSCPRMQGKLNLDLDFMGIWETLVILNHSGSDTLFFKFYSVWTEKVVPKK